MKTSTILEEKGEDLQLLMNESYEIGIDEVGRGCIFGPVFSAVVILSKNNGLILKELGLRDSKKLTKIQREKLVPKIFSLSFDWGIGQSSVREIEKYGIRHATEISMIRSIKKLQKQPKKIIIDGNLPLRLWDGTQKNEIRGDSRFPSIAAASVIAKVKRDRLLNNLSEQYKDYYLDKNKGYGTKEHFLSLKKNGITKLHRRNFLKKLKTF